MLKTIEPEPKVIDDCDDDDACMGTAGFAGDKDETRTWTEAKLWTSLGTPNAQFI